MPINAKDAEKYLPPIESKYGSAVVSVQRNVKTRLLGSAGSLEDLKALVERFYCGENVTFVAKSKDEWAVHNESGELNGFRVVLKKRRFRFEMETEVS